MSHPDATALIVVDMQNAFISPGAGPAVDGAETVVAAVNARVEDAVNRGWPVFYTRDVGPTELPAGDPDGQTEVYPGLEVTGTVVDKGPGKDGGMSGFVLHRAGPGDGGLSDLASLLNAVGCRSVVVVGLAADVCVAATARDAQRLGYDVAIDLDATAFVHAHPAGDHAAVSDLRSAGIIVRGVLPRYGGDGDL